jgi:hypothetical protein
MQVSRSCYAPIGKPLFAGASPASPLKLGEIPILAEGIPDSVVSGAIERVKNGSFFREYQGCIPAGVSLRVFQQGGNAQIEIQGLPALGEKRYQQIHGPVSIGSIAGGLNDVLRGFGQMQREGQP